LTAWYLRFTGREPGSFFSKDEDDETTAKIVKDLFGDDSPNKSLYASCSPVEESESAAAWILTHKVSKLHKAVYGLRISEEELGPYKSSGGLTKTDGHTGVSPVDDRHWELDVGPNS